MALNLQNKYTGRFDPVSADYPQGKFKNRSSPTAQDGSYMERDWLNDWNGFFGALLSNAGVTPNGDVDTAQASQFYNALWTVVQKLLPKRSFLANDRIRIPDVPNGLMVQFGTIPSVSGTDVVSATITFPELFPTSCLAVIAITTSPTSGGGQCFVQVKTITNASADIFVVERAGGAIQPHGVRYIAIGW